MFTLVTKNVIIGLSIKPVSLKIEVRTDIITISKKTMIFDATELNIILALLFFVFVNFESLKRSLNELLNFFIK